MVLQYLVFACFQGGKGSFLAVFKKKKIRQLNSILEGRQLGWERLMWPREVFGQFFILPGWSAFSRFLILMSSSSSAQMLTCKCLNFQNSQAEILNYEILNMCRVLYTLHTVISIPFLRQTELGWRRRRHAVPSKLIEWPSVT